jgi:Protein of unknown function (DUF3141)
LNWISDLYGSVNEIAAHGHVIIYTLHESIGHLGIFVSAQVANKQHEQIGSVVKTIESLAPGLYEMLISKEQGVYSVAFDARTIVFSSSAANVRRRSNSPRSRGFPSGQPRPTN